MTNTLDERVDLRRDPTAGQDTAPRRSRIAARTRRDPFPRDPLARWALRLLLSIPYLLIAAIATATGQTRAVNTPNQQLLDRVAGIDWNRADPEWIGEIFPPITTLLATAIPGGRAGLAVAGALVAGVFLQKLIEFMVQRRFAISTVIILALAIGANPLFAYTATENFSAFIGLCFFSIAISDVVRFVAWRDTRSGFRAGMLLMLATLSDLTGLVYVLTSAVAAPFLRLARANQKGARSANVLVIIYPTMSALAAILFLTWVFTGDVFNSFGVGILEGTAERFASLGQTFVSVDGLLLVAPLLCAWVVALIVRRLGSILLTSLVFVAVLGSFVLGFIPLGSAGNTFILISVMAIALVPAARGRAQTRLVDVVAVVLIALAWGAAFNREIVSTWMSAVGAAFVG